jgi:hypothetical protein
VPFGFGVVGEEIHFSSLNGWTPCGAGFVEKVIVVSDRKIEITCELCARYVEGRKVVNGLIGMWQHWTRPVAFDIAV